eukprot:IDg4551t1
MGPEGLIIESGVFTDKTPPAFDGHSNYAAYRKDVAIWLLLTTLNSKKQGPALIGRLSGEAKSAAKSLELTVIASENGANAILERLDQSYGIDETDQLDIDLAAFLDFTWNGRSSIDQFIAGFNNRLDKISELKINNRLKGHLLIRQACLDTHSRNMIVGAASGKFEITAVANSLRQAYRITPSSTMTASTTNPRNRTPNAGRRNNSLGEMQHKQASNRHDRDHKRNTTFFTFKSEAKSQNYRAILDTGACTSVVGKNTLNDAMRNLNITSVPDATPAQEAHRFGDNHSEHRTLFAIEFPIRCTQLIQSNKIAKFNVKFDVIEGNLPFLIGFPSFKAMKASLNFNKFTLGFMLINEYIKVALEHDNNHLYLPLRPISSPTNGVMGLNYPQSASSHYTVQGYNQSSYSPPDITHEPSSNLDISTGHYALNARLESPSPSNPLPIGSYSLNESVFASTIPFNVCDLRKLHLQLHHRSKSQIIQWIKSANRWDATLESVSTLSSTTANARLPQLLNAFKRIQVLRHGAPLTVQADNQFNKDEFINYLKDIGAKFIASAANDHEANGAIESANRILKTHFRRIRSSDHRSSLPDLLSEATYAKNINTGNKLASAFELLYGRQPRVMDSYQNNRAPVTVSDQARHATRQRIDHMMRSNVRKLPLIRLGDYVLYWRDGRRWIGPAKVLKIENGVVSLLHGESTKTSSLNRVIKVQAPTTELNISSEYDDLEDSQPSSIDHKAQTDSPETQQTILPRPPAGSSAQPTIEQKRMNTATLTREQDSARKSAVLARQSLQELNTESDEEEPLGMPGAPWIPRSRSGNYLDMPPPRNTELYDIPNYQESPIPFSYMLKACREPSQHNENQLLMDNETPISDKQPIDLTKARVNWKHENPTLFNDTIPNQLWQENTLHDSTLTNPTPTQPSQILESEKAESYANERSMWTRMKAIMVIQRCDVPHSANIIGSHVVYRRKPSGKVKARIVPWGHRDSDKDFLRKDAPCINPEILHLVLSIAAEHKWLICKMDITAAYFKLKALIVTFILWYLTSDAALRNEFGLTKSRLEQTLYYRKDHAQQLSFIVLIQVDNYLYAGTSSEILDFEKSLCATFDVGEQEHSRFFIYGCEVNQSLDHSITMTQLHKIQELPDKLLLAGLPRGDRAASAAEATLYRSIIGQILFVGRLSQPLMLRIASQMATKLNNLNLHHLRDLESLLKTCKERCPTLLFRSTPSVGSFSIDVYSDASQGQKKDPSPRGGFIIMRRLGDVTHAIQWSSRKLRRVARSSSTAELLAAAEAIDTAIYLQELLNELLYWHPMDFSTDSRSLFTLITTTKEPEERRNKIDIAAMRNAFDIGQLRSINWIPGYYLIADALTKDNRTLGTLIL